MLYSTEDIDDLIDQFHLVDGVTMQSKTPVNKPPGDNLIIPWWRPCIGWQDFSFAKLDLRPEDETVYAKASALLWQRLSQYIEISEGLTLKVSVNNCPFWMNMAIAPNANFVDAFHLYEQHAELIGVGETHQFLVGVLTEDPTEHQEQLWLYLLRYEMDTHHQPIFTPC